MKPMKMPKGMSTDCLPQHKRLAMGLPVNKMMGSAPKGSKTPA